MTGYFKKSIFKTAKNTKTDSKNEIKKPKKVNLSAFLVGKFIIAPPKVNKTDNHTK